MHQARIKVVENTLSVSLCQGWMAIEAAWVVLSGFALDEALPATIFLIFPFFGQV